jgi:hypothetical protein
VSVQAGAAGLRPLGFKASAETFRSEVTGAGNVFAWAQAQAATA